MCGKASILLREIHDRVFKSIYLVLLAFIIFFPFQLVLNFFRN